MPHSVISLPHESPDALSAWLGQQASKVHAFSEGFLFALVDIARISPAQRLKLPGSIALALARQSTNLYADLEGTALAESGPRLCVASEATLHDWAVVTCQTHAVSFMAGCLGREDLANHLMSLREVMLPDGSEALFRFQDGHVTQHLWPRLTPSLANQILGPLHWWATPDVCGPLHVLHPAERHVHSSGLRFDRTIFDGLNEDLLVYTVADQVREVDMSLLAGLSECEIRNLLLERLDAARQLGLKLQSDLALFVVLSLQLPAGFDRKEPFVAAIESNRQGHQAFGEALEHVPASHWKQWNVDLANS
jgi:hypothetical protein